MKYLFIGGPADGKHVLVQHVELDKPFIIKSPNPTLENAVRDHAVNGPRPGTIEIIAYWPHQLWFGNEQETVYALHRHEDSIKIIRALIAGYTKPMERTPAGCAKPPIKFDFPADPPIVNGNDDFLMTI